jgi:uncharacterized membrane protein
MKLIDFKDPFSILGCVLLMIAVVLACHKLFSILPN